MASMWWDLSLQALVFLISIFTYLWMNDIPRKYMAKYHAYRDKSKHESRRHFVKAAELLSKAKSNPRSSSLSQSYASASVLEADKAVALFPSDAANHIVKALALDFQGFKTSALDAINVALSPLAVKSLEKDEMVDAIVKRAELRIEVSRLSCDSVGKEVWETVEREMREAVEMRRESGRAWCLLGESCEGLGKREKAREAFEEALKVEPEMSSAMKGLERVNELTSE